MQLNPEERNTKVAHDAHFWAILCGLARSICAIFFLFPPTRHLM